MEKEKNQNYSDKLSIFFRCKKCLTIQRIIKIVLSEYNRPMTSIYIFTLCQNDHFEKYKLKNISDLNEFNLNNKKCSSCTMSHAIYYCLSCYKIFCLKCKDEHAKNSHNKIIKLEDIDSICPKHFPTKPVEKLLPFYICEKCEKGYFTDDDEDDDTESYFNEIKENNDEIIEQLQKDLIKIYKRYDNSKIIKNSITSFEKRINEELNFIKVYYCQSRNILKKYSKLNVNIYNNLNAFKLNNPLKKIITKNNYKKKDILHFFHFDHLFSNYNGYEELNLEINKLLNIKEEEYNFEINPEKLEFNRTLVEEEDANKTDFDIFTNKNKIPIFVFWKNDSINFMNLINYKIDYCISTTEMEITKAKRLKYYKFNNNEYLLSLLLNKSSQIINIYELNNNFNIKFTIDKDKDDIEILNCNLFYYQNELKIYICFSDNNCIYNIDNKELLTSIGNKNNCGDDFIFIDKNNSCYIL